MTGQNDPRYCIVILEVVMWAINLLIAVVMHIHGLECKRWGRGLEKLQG
jgi:hypothetical protein